MESREDRRSAHLHLLNKEREAQKKVAISNPGYHFFWSGETGMNLYHLLRNDGNR